MGISAARRCAMPPRVFEEQDEKRGEARGSKNIGTGVATFRRPRRGRGRSLMRTSTMIFATAMMSFSATARNRLISPGAMEIAEGCVQRTPRRDAIFISGSFHPRPVGILNRLRIHPHSLQSAALGHYR